MGTRQLKQSKPSVFGSNSILQAPEGETERIGKELVPCVYACIGTTNRTFTFVENSIGRHRRRDVPAPQPTKGLYIH